MDFLLPSFSETNKPLIVSQGLAKLFWLCLQKAIKKSEILSHENGKYKEMCSVEINGSLKAKQQSVSFFKLSISDRNELFLPCQKQLMVVGVVLQNFISAKCLCTRGLGKNKLKLPKMIMFDPKSEPFYITFCKYATY